MPPQKDHIPFGNVLSHGATREDDPGLPPGLDINSLFAAGGNEPWAAALSPGTDASDRKKGRAASQQSRMSRWFSSEEDGGEGAR